jgi:hypothetical protein
MAPNGRYAIFRSFRNAGIPPIALFNDAKDLYLG